MSLRYASRVLYQEGMRAVQGMKDQASKCDYSIKYLRDHSTTSSKQGKRFSGALDSTAFKAVNNSDDDKIKQTEESLRTVMYLSCWGPN